MSSKYRLFDSTNNKSNLESIKSCKQSTNLISFGFLRFTSNPFHSNSNIDSNHKIIEFNQTVYVKSAFKSLNTLWTNHLIDKSIKQSFISNEKKNKQLFETNKSLIFKTKSEQNLNAWKINETFGKNYLDIERKQKPINNFEIDSINSISRVNQYYSKTFESFERNISQIDINREFYSKDSETNKRKFDLQFDQKNDYLKRKIQNNNNIYCNNSFDSTVDKNKKRKVRKNSSDIYRNKCLVSEFIDCEAEVVLDSIHSYSDDEENTQKECLNSSSSFVDDNTLIDSQPIGQLIGGIDSRMTEDMKSVYLQSVKDKLIGNVSKYKLQYNYDQNIDVYSQEPNQSQMGDYELDSFCVDNDCVVYDNSPKIESQFNYCSESPSPQMKLRQRKKFKRIIFNP